MSTHALRTFSSFVSFLLVLASPAWSETVHLIPEEKAAWGPGRMFGFLRPGHNYGDRKIEVETTPSHAVLDLYYVRAGFQKRYEQAEAPAVVVLPKRSQATGRDAVTIRASAEGYRAKQVTVRVHGSEDHVLLELEPLANTLQAVAHTYFGGRGSLTFLTDEALQVRLQDGQRFFSVALHETARGPDLEETFSQVRSPLISSLTAQPLGDDLMVKVALTKQAQDAVLDLRSSQRHDPVRDLYSYSLDLVPADGGARAIERARTALAEIQTQDVEGCALEFDETLRASLDPSALSRSLTPRGAFTDRYLRAAMKRLGEVSANGRIQMLDGSRYSPASPLELSAAMSQASQARGYLAALRRFVELLEPAEQQRVTLRSLLAPESGSEDFDALLTAAESAERGCKQG